MQKAAEKQKITMAQIARELGLSRMTVSSVLNNHAEERRISEKTVRKVQEHMLSRGYVPYRHARTLRMGKTDAAGILHSGDIYSHLTDAYNRMCSLFSKSPQRLELMVVPRQEITEGIRELIARGVSCLVWFHTSGHEEELGDPAIENYLSRVTPVIYNYRFSSKKDTAGLLERGCYLIGVDRQSGYIQLARLLRSLGHRAVIAPDAALNYMIRAFEAERMKVFPLQALPGENSGFEAAGRAAARACLPYIRDGRATAVCFGDDMVAGYALSEFHKMGISVPADVTVTGFDGLEIVSAFHPHLTTLKMPVAEMVDCAGKIISGGAAKQKNLFQMRLLEGKSHGKAAQKPG